jgi:tRNA threonylcarbamoyl adenosine modification protein YjeE
MIAHMAEANELAVENIVTTSAEESFRFGFNLARSLNSPKNIFLYGDLGAGKTVLAKGIVCGLGAEDPDDIVSPSFTLIQEYRAQGKAIHHVDLYRLDSPRDIDGLGIDELLQDDAAYVIVEWAEKLPYAVIPSVVEIHLTDLGDDRRSIRVKYK